MALSIIRFIFSFNVVILHRNENCLGIQGVPISVNEIWSYFQRIERRGHVFFQMKNFRDFIEWVQQEIRPRSTTRKDHNILGYLDLMGPLIRHNRGNIRMLTYGVSNIGVWFFLPEWSPLQLERHVCINKHDVVKDNYR